MTLPSTVLDVLATGRQDVRGMIKFQFGTGTYGFIKSHQPLDFNGLTYVPGGIIQVSDLTGGLGTVARQFSISLAASPNDGLTPDVLVTIEQEDYRDRPVTIYDAHFHPDTGVLLWVEALLRGYVDVIDHSEDLQSGYTITAQCETRALDYTRTNGRLRTNADQARRSAGDLFYNNASRRGREEIWWGQEKRT